MNEQTMRLRLKRLGNSPQISDEIVSTMPSEYRLYVEMRPPEQASGAALADVIVVAMITGGSAVLVALINAAVALYNKPAKTTDTTQKETIIIIDGTRKSRRIEVKEPINEQILSEIADECGEILEITLDK
jgi:cytochrome c-type biogenesis protein CcmH/NrfF